MYTLFLFVGLACGYVIGHRKGMLKGIQTAKEIIEDTPTGSDELNPNPNKGYGKQRRRNAPASGNRVVCQPKEPK